ncbi:hypothetical protein BaRGS_00010179, partial [Batillaria attramentaria]
ATPKVYDLFLAPCERRRQAVNSLQAALTELTVGSYPDPLFWSSTCPFSVSLCQLQRWSRSCCHNVALECPSPARYTFASVAFAFVAVLEGRAHKFTEATERSEHSLSVAAQSPCPYCDYDVSQGR